MKLITSTALVSCALLAMAAFESASGAPALMTRRSPQGANAAAASGSDLFKKGSRREECKKADFAANRCYTARKCESKADFDAGKCWFNEQSELNGSKLRKKCTKAQFDAKSCVAGKKCDEKARFDAGKCWSLDDNHKAYVA